MPKTLGQAIRELREQAGVTRSALARAAHLDPAVLSRIEAGERSDLRFSTVCRLAAALGVSTDDIAARAGLLKHKGVVPGAPAAYGAKFQTSISGLETLLSRAGEHVAQLKKLIRPRS